MKLTTKLFLNSIVLGAIISTAAAQEFTLVKNFESEWRVFQNGRYEPFENAGRVNSIYFNVEVNKFSGNFLHIKSLEPFTLFINGELVEKSDAALNLNIDSLRGIFQASIWQVSLYQDKIGKRNLQTLIQSKASRSSETADPLLLRFASFRDFAIVGMLVLMVMLIVIIQLNPKLASDYFSVTKIFSVREGEDTQAYSRITSSINILFYVYSSLMLSYYLMIIFHFLPSQYQAALSFQSSTFWEALMNWLELSLIVLGLFFMKIMLVYVLSFLFGFKELGGIHFFNWVRLLLGVFGVLSIVLFLYFITHGQREGFYAFFLGAMSWVLAGWIVLIIFKLQRQMDHSLFHLFSYICATELIPFLITLKVLYY